MILTTKGEAYIYADSTYRIGDSVVANDSSPYQGLLGTITEIRCGKDKETENETPDIYCSFDPPATPCELYELEERFTRLRGKPTYLSTISLDCVIMAPDMIRVLEPLKPPQELTIYTICEKWAWDGNCGIDTQYALDYDVARRILAKLIRDETESGCIAEMKERKGFDVESTPMFYECWIQDEYCESHYQASITTKELTVNSDVLSVIGKAYVENRFREQFYEQIVDWEELEGLTDAQIRAMVESPEVPLRIRKQLERNGTLIEAYWEALSEAAFALVKNYLKTIS